MAELLPVDQRQAFIEDVITRFRSVATIAAGTAAEGVHATTDINNEDAAEAARQQLDTAEVAHESAEEVVAAAAAEFEAMLSMRNWVDKLVVKVVAKTVKVHKMVVQFRDISKKMLRELRSYVCAGFYRAGLLQKLIPPSRLHIETLHLILNTGNCWIEVARKVLQYSLTADGNAASSMRNSTPLTLMSRLCSIRKPSVGQLSAPSPTTPCPLVRNG
jgi:hypothetical protein